MNQESNKPARQLTGSWGILGGAFDPIHQGHLTLAFDILTAKQLTGVLLVPSFRPLLKRDTCLASFENRVAMVQLATAENPFFEVSTIEAEMSRPGYTLNTVRALKREYPQVQFYFLIGADLLSQVADWHRPEEILKEVPLLVGSRPADKGTGVGRPYDSDRIECVRTGLVDISSSTIRERIKRGVSFKELSGLVGSKVAQYIVNRKLYQ